MPRVTGNPWNVMVCAMPYLQNEFGDPQFFYIFNLILSFSTCCQRLKKVCTWVRNFWAWTSLTCNTCTLSYLLNDTNNHYWHLLSLLAVKILESHWSVYFSICISWVRTVSYETFIEIHVEYMPGNCWAIPCYRRFSQRANFQTYM